MKFCMVCGLSTRNDVCPDHFCGASTSPQKPISVPSHEYEKRECTYGFAVKANYVPDDSFTRIKISEGKRMGLPPGFAAGIAEAIKTVNNKMYPPADIDVISHIERREHFNA